jgi:hypothetical protein
MTLADPHALDVLLLPLRATHENNHQAAIAHQQPAIGKHSLLPNIEEQLKSPVRLPASPPAWPPMTLKTSMYTQYC